MARTKALCGIFGLCQKAQRAYIFVSASEEVSSARYEQVTSRNDVISSKYYRFEMSPARTSQMTPLH